MAEINLVDTLLSKDIETLTARETSTYVVESLSKKANTNFEITLQALKAKDFMRLRKQCSTTDKKGKHNEALVRHYKVANPAELVLSMFTVGEIGDMVTKINELSGNNIEDAEAVEEEVKN